MEKGCEDFYVNSILFDVNRLDSNLTSCIESITVAPGKLYGLLGGDVISEALGYTEGRNIVLSCTGYSEDVLLHEAFHNVLRNGSLQNYVDYMEYYQT